MMSEHGQDYDWMNQPIDPQVVYASGGGKPHGRYPMFGSVIDSTQVRPERSRPSRSSSRGPRSSTQGNAELIRMQEALRRQEEYNKQQQEYWAAQFARQQEMMQQIALGQRPDFSAMTMPPPPPIPQFVPTPQFSWPTPVPQVPPGNLLTPRNEDSEDAVASFVDGLLNSGGASGSNQPHPFDQPPPFE